MKISIVTCCSASRQRQADITMPLFLGQIGPEELMELVISCDDGLVLPPDPRIVRSPMYFFGPGDELTGFKMCSSLNAAFDKAQGDVILLVQSDMRFRSRYQVKDMADALKPGTFVTERFYHEDGRKDLGIYCQCLMIRKDDLMVIGGYDPRFDGIPGEDGMMVTSLLERGLELIRLEHPQDSGVEHIAHPRPDYNLPDNAAKIRRGRDMFYQMNNRTPKSVGAMYAHVMKIKEIPHEEA